MPVRELCISPSTMSRAASRYRDEHGRPINGDREADELIAPLHPTTTSRSQPQRPLALTS